MPDDYSGGGVKKQPGQNDPGIEVGNAPAPPDNPHAQNAETVSEQRVTSEIRDLGDRIRRSEKWMIWLTGGIVFLTAGIVIVGVLQWNAMRGQLDVMKTTLAEMKSSGEGTTNQTNQVIGNLNWLASLMDGSLRQTQAALNQSHDSFIRDQRPYLWPNAVIPEPGQIAAGKEMFWRIYYSNYGHSPAVHAIGNAGLFYGPKAMDDADDYFVKLPKILTGPVAMIPQGGPPVTPPGQTGESGQSFTSVRSGSLLTDKDVAFIFGHDFAIAIVGRFQYRDISGNTYWTDFCRSTFVTGAINTCGKHNEIH